MGSNIEDYRVLSVQLSCNQEDKSVNTFIDEINEHLQKGYTLHGTTSIQGSWNGNLSITQVVLKYAVARGSISKYKLHRGVFYHYYTKDQYDSLEKKDAAARRLFELTVCEDLRNGWSLYGDLQCIKMKDTHPNFIQALVMNNLESKTDNRIEELGARIDAHTASLSTLGARIDASESRTGDRIEWMGARVDASLSRMDTRIKTVETRIDASESKMDTHMTAIAESQVKLGTCIKTAVASIVTLESKMDTRMTAIEQSQDKKSCEVGDLIDFPPVDIIRYSIDDN